MHCPGLPLTADVGTSGTYPLFRFPPSVCPSEEKWFHNVHDFLQAIEDVSFFKNQI